MIVRLHKSQLDYARRKARSTPNEIYGLLFGHLVNAQCAEIHKITYPKLDTSTPNGVDINPASLEEHIEDAAEDGHKLIGGIHSHPNYIPVMSKTDHCNHKEWEDTLSGIISIINRKTTVCFWTADSSLPAEIKYF